MNSMDEEIEILSEKMMELQPKNWADLARCAIAVSTLLPHRIGFYVTLNPEIWEEAQNPIQNYYASQRAHTALLRGADFFNVLDQMSGTPSADFSDDKAIGHRVAAAIKVGLHLERLADAVGFSILGKQEMAPEQFLENARVAAGDMRAEMEDAYMPWDIEKAAHTILASEFRTEKYNGMITACFVKPKFTPPRKNLGAPELG